jgi:MFS family permease
LYGIYYFNPSQSDHPILLLSVQLKNNLLGNPVRHYPSGSDLRGPLELPTKPNFLQTVRQHLNRNSFIVTAAFSIIGTLMIFIPTFPTLIIARIMQGACVGVYSATVPIFIN